MNYASPIPMLLWCPKCNAQHIDEPSEGWDNPPHRSHLCHACGCIWRPADVATTGVKDIKTAGDADTWGWTGGDSLLPSLGARLQVALDEHAADKARIGVLRGAFPKEIGRRHLGERVSDGERRCDWEHDIPAGHPLYWLEQFGQYDDSDPVCIEHAIEQYASETGYGSSAGSDFRLEAADARFTVLAKAVKNLLPIGDATKPDSVVFPIYVRMSELRALHELVALSLGGEGAE